MSKPYHVELLPKARRELDDIPAAAFSKIDKELRVLAKNPRPWGVKKLDKDLHRIRIGRFRVIYAVLDKEARVVILRIAQRNEKTYKDP